MGSAGAPGLVLKPLSDQSFTGKLEIAAGKVYTIGRSQSCDFVFKDGRVSRKHCQVLLVSSSSCLVLYHGTGLQHDLGTGCKRKNRDEGTDFELVKTTVIVDGERLEYGTSKLISSGAQVQLVVKSPPVIGFVVETHEQAVKVNAAQRTERPSVSVTCSRVEMDESYFSQGVRSYFAHGSRKENLAPVYQGHIKRVKVSVEKIIQESRRLRNECCNVASRLTKDSTVARTLSEASGVELRTNGETIIQESRRLRTECCNVASRVTEDSTVVQTVNKAISDSGLELRTNEETISAKVAETVNVKILKHVQTESSGLRLNQLEDVQPMGSNVSLKEILEPIEDIEALFVATFVSDILWFLSSACLPKTLAVTVACHDSERCWSTSQSDRLEYPYPEWPNLRVLYPPFPVLRKTADKSRMRGIGCHHPKFFLIKRSNSIRVVITSANLNYRQWFQMSNTIWWQDFPVRTTKDYDSLFFPKACNDASTMGDFAAQLAAFISYLVKDAHTEAHWVVSLANYDFSKAAVSLVASVPGFHEPPFPQGQLLDKKCFGTVLSAVVGISHRFHPRFDSNGAHLRRLAILLNGVAHDSDGTIHVLLRRAKDLPVDPNAVSVFAVLGPDNVPFLEQEPTQGLHGELHIGFLPKRTAAWVASLCDAGICSFKAKLWPKQMLAVAAGQSSVAHLVVYVYQGPTFLELPSKVLKLEEMSAMTNLLRLLQRNYGLWRLQEVLSMHKWPDSAEKEFVYSSSSIGTSLNAKFVAAFSAAAGRRATANDDGCESDPEWGCWTAQHEKAKPSIKVLFPSIDCLRNAKSGPSSYRGIMCFPERTWERLKTTGLLHHAIPSVPSRIGTPMHLKVAQRHFEDKSSKVSFGWMYTGSHNFSPAAWGKCVKKSAEKELLQRPNTRLHICNYELGIVFMEPLERGGNRFEDFKFPLLLPATKYSPTDRPATGRAIYELLQELGEDEKSVVNEAGEQDTELPSDIEIEAQDSEEDDSCSSAQDGQLTTPAQGI